MNSIKSSTHHQYRFISFMSSSNSRLAPPIKVWTLIRNKLLIKSSKSKVLKKQKIKSNGLFWWPFPSVHSKKCGINSRSTYKTKHYYLQKGPLPVFVDHLFVETRSVVDEELFEKSQGSSTMMKNYAKKGGLEMMRNGFKGDDNTSAADDVWESLAQMDGIDQRAEDFIAKFRADMLHQELGAHHSCTSQ